MLTLCGHGFSGDYIVRNKIDSERGTHNQSLRKNDSEIANWARRRVSHVYPHITEVYDINKRILLILFYITSGVTIINVNLVIIFVGHRSSA